MRIVEIKRRPEINGKIGKVERWVRQKNRWEVRLDSMQANDAPLGLKASNLQRVVGTPTKLQDECLAGKLNHDHQIECSDGAGQNELAQDKQSRIGSDDSCASSGSFVSAATNQPKCYRVDQLVKTSSNFFIRIGDLRKGSDVIAASGAVLKVSSVRIHPEAEQTLVKLNTRSALLTVTASHRIMVQRTSGPQTVAAGALKVGDEVLVAAGHTESLVAVTSMQECLEIVEVAFSPDEAVEVFEPLQPGILSKGHGYPKTRRGKKASLASSRISIPGTEDSWS